MTSGASMPPATRKVRVGDADIHVTEWGNGPPVLLLHGNPDSGAMWKGIAEHLRARHRCIAPDLPGFGHSDSADAFQPSLDGMAQFVEQFLVTANVERPLDLIAHDFGGPVHRLGSQTPDAVHRLVAINTVFFSDYRWHFQRVWRTPILGELSMLVMNKPMFAQELRRGSSRISQAHIDQTYALMTPRMKKQVLRLYRASNPTKLQAVGERFSGADQDQADLGDLGRQGPLRLAALRRAF